MTFRWDIFLFCHIHFHFVRLAQAMDKTKTKQKKTKKFRRRKYNMARHDTTWRQLRATLHVYAYGQQQHIYTMITRFATFHCISRHNVCVVSRSQPEDPQKDHFVPSSSSFTSIIMLFPQLLNANHLNCSFLPIFVQYR